MKNKNSVYYMLIAVFFFVDQITKWIFSSRDFFVGPVHLRLVKNYGLSFGINFGNTIDLLLIFLALVLFIYYFIRKWDQGMFDIWAALVILGAILNLFDRFYLGYVRDFIDLNLGFVFNLADVFIVLGLAGLILKS